MAMAYPRPPRRLLVVLDLVLLAWIAAWIYVGVAVGREVKELGRLSTTVSLAGGALVQTGDVVGSLGSVPFVGDDVGEVADRLRETGRSAQRNARVSRRSVEDLSILLGLSIGLIPTVPLAVLYVPLRVRWRREASTIKRALSRDPPDTALEGYLALRAAQNLPYERLRAVSDDPAADIAQGRTQALAQAELERLGLRRPRRSR